MNALNAQLTYMPPNDWRDDRRDDWTKRHGEEESRVTLLEAKAYLGTRRVPQWLFVSRDEDRVMSTVPVDVEISEEALGDPVAGSAYVFSCKKLHVFASSRRYEEAKASFDDQVVYFFRTYMNTPADVMDEDAAAIREVYARYFSDVTDR